MRPAWLKDFHGTLASYLKFKGSNPRYPFCNFSLTTAYKYSFASCSLPLFFFPFIFSSSKNSHKQAHSNKTFHVNMATLFFISQYISRYAKQREIGLHSLCIDSCDTIFVSIIHSQPQQCQSLQDIYNTAKYLWHQQRYSKAYRIFHALGEQHQYKTSTCAWYQVQCLLALHHWHQAVLVCLEQAKRCSSEQWYLIASDIYMNRCDYTLAWEILNRAPDSTNILDAKRLAYEGIQHRSCIRRNDILDKLPYDVAISVFLCLDLPSLVRCTRVSKRWRCYLVDSPQLWNELEFANKL